MSDDNNHLNNKQREQEEGAAAAAAPSLAARAAGFWTTIRNAVKEEATEFKHAVLNPRRDTVEVYMKPICLDGAQCKLGSNRDHMQRYRHLCPYGFTCNNKWIGEHSILFIHDAVCCTGVPLVPGEDNDEIKDNKESSSSSCGLDFLDEAVSMSRKAKEGGRTAKNFKLREELIETRTAGIAPIRCTYGDRQFKILHYVQTAQWWPNGWRPSLDDEDERLSGGVGAQPAQSSSSSAAAMTQSQQQQQQQPGAGQKVTDFFTSLFGRSKADEAKSPQPPVAGAKPLNSSAVDDDDEEENNSLLGGGKGESHPM